MAGIDDVLERLVTDPAFKEQLAHDPATALAGYDLTEDDLTLLDSQVDSAGGLGSVEQRTSKSGLFGLLSGVTDSIKWAGPPEPADDYVLTDVQHPAPSRGGVQGGVFVAVGDVDGGHGDDTITVKGSDIKENHLKQLGLATTHYDGPWAPPAEPGLTSGIAEPEEAAAPFMGAKGAALPAGGSGPVESFSINFEPVKDERVEGIRKQFEDPMQE